MGSIEGELHILSLFDNCSDGESGMMCYPAGDQAKPLWLSYRDLQTLAGHKASMLRLCNMSPPGSITLIHFDTQLNNIIWFWASIMACYIPCLSTPLVNSREGRISHFNHLKELLLDPLVITDEELAKKDFMDNESLRIVPVETIESPNNQSSSSTDTTSNPRVSFGTTSLHGIAALMLTSGSTGNAKAVTLSHEQIFASVQGKAAWAPSPKRSTFLNWVAMDHVASLTEIHLSAMFCGFDQVHVPAANIVPKPLYFLRLLSKYRVVKTFAPQFFLAKLQKELETASPADLEGIDLQHLLYIISGGEANQVQTCFRVAEQLANLGVTNKNVIMPGFGMTETCAGSIYSRSCPECDVQAGAEFAGLGDCVPGIQMRVLPISSDADYLIEESAPTNTGSLELRGPIVFQGYFNNEEATREAFTDDGWFKTGDLASIDDNGHLRLIGRSKDLININGVKYIPHEIETAIEQSRIPGVAPHFIACFAHRSQGSPTEEVFVVYQHEYEPNDVASRLQTLHSVVRIVLLFTGTRPCVLPLAPGQLEKSTLGKLSRTKIQKSLYQGQYRDQEELNSQLIEAHQKANFQAPQTEIEKTLMRLLLTTLGLEDIQISIDTPTLDAGMSSVDLIRLKVACEREFGIPEIPMITVMTNITIQSLGVAIKKLLQSESGPVQYDPVVTLQYAGAQAPLWLIHPGIGEILVFLGLVQYFPDRPIHTLRARGFNAGEEPFRDLDDVLQCYYAALKEKQPHGPYAIAGYSYGSMVAFEIAKLLEANGDTVQFVGSFNLPPHIKTRMQQLDWTGGLMHIAHFCGLITEERSEELTLEIKADNVEGSDQVAMVLSESDPERLVDLALTQESLTTWVNVSFALQNIGWEYEPSGSVSGMDIFYCQPLKVVAKTREEYRNTKLNHWVDFARNEVRYHEVGGEHYTMIGPDYVPKFQQTLKNALAARGL
ncbi:Acetyl-CoA synthetase-like protein [Penicillium angulare]|uniref:Acetyl-CoA synthetase-like protein n=1 Tax=Penicillium angulare TaxID=116970 RepID=UPI002541B3F3|nr:Acetyl-CoA synthetase-like protein [Penicillium angulare]KAJ5267453.1 Acetyl-CoA synthetase-like protein [Penicillium angulare]